MGETIQKEFRWLPCPVCKNRTHTKVYEDTVLVKYPLFCTKCKTETVVDVAMFKLTVRDRDGK
ncbi:MAG: conjugal transfer protein [Oscillospiraceae bacterium]|nr:conjugal transfer protein [Oscillospiraceae bacterium]